MRDRDVLNATQFTSISGNKVKIFNKCSLNNGLVIWENYSGFLTYLLYLKIYRWNKDFSFEE